MEQQPNQLAQRKSPLAMAFNVFVVLLIMVIIGQVLQIRSLTDRIAELELQRTTEDKQSADDPNYNEWSTVVKSGNGGFQLTLPDGWGPVINDTKSDFVVMMGMTQPTLVRGSKVTVTETQGFGTDAPSLFGVMLLNKSEAAPPDTRGTAEEFSIGKAEDEVRGTKYTYIYPQDVFVDGIGGQHFQGDRDYEYVLPVGDKELRVYYRVYGSDPRNLSATVDEIVRRITLARNSAN